MKDTNRTRTHINYEPYIKVIISELPYALQTPLMMAVVHLSIRTIASLALLSRFRHILLIFIHHHPILLRIVSSSGPSQCSYYSAPT